MSTPNPLFPQQIRTQDEETVEIEFLVARRNLQIAHLPVRDYEVGERVKVPLSSVGHFVSRQQARLWDPEVARKAQEEAERNEQLEAEKRAKEEQEQRDARILEILNGLDPALEAHWNKDGSPSMDIIERTYGSSDVSRADVDRVAPNFNRKTAQAQS